MAALIWASVCVDWAPCFVHLLCCLGPLLCPSLPLAWYVYGILRVSPLIRYAPSPDTVTPPPPHSPPPFHPLQSLQKQLEYERGRVAALEELKKWRCYNKGAVELLRWQHKGAGEGGAAAAEELEKWSCCVGGAQEVAVTVLGVAAKRCFCTLPETNAAFGPETHAEIVSRTVKQPSCHAGTVVAAQSDSYLLARPPAGCCLMANRFGTYVCLWM